MYNIILLDCGRECQITVFFVVVVVVFLSF